MVVIRLARTGRTKYPTYRIVAADSKRAATGKFVEVLGHYNPHTKELTIKKEETMKRIGNGAQPSNTIVKLMLREKMELPAWVKLKTKQAKVVEDAKVEAEESAADEAASVDADVSEPQAKVTDDVVGAKAAPTNKSTDDASAEKTEELTVDSRDKPVQKSDSAKA